MEQTHYTTLNINKNASTEVIKLAYERLLEEAKLKLEDSPLFFEKEQKLKEAYQILSNLQRREYYDNKLIRERINKSPESKPVASGFNISELFVPIFSSKILWGGLVVAALIAWISPGKQEQLIHNNQQQILKKYQDIQNQQLERMRQEELFYSGAKNNSSSDYQARMAKQKKQREEKAEQRKLEREIKQIERDEQRALSKIERDEGRLEKKKQRDDKRSSQKLQQQLASEKRARERREKQQQYEAKKRSDVLIRKQQSQQYKQQRNESISSGSL